MTADLTLRRYRPTDCDRVLAVHEAALRDEGVYVEGAPEPDLEDVQAAYRDAGGAFLVGELDGELVATGAFRPAGGYLSDFLEVTDDTAELKRMRVDPDHQGRGFGRQVYRELERRARTRGFSELVLDTMPSLTAARGLYESEGFERVRREQFRTESEGTFELLFYRKRLEG
jgi:ribosomal protein S18 acetylase RimI-like enzyme